MKIKNKFENGVHVISNNEYHSAEGFSRSQLMDFRKSPKHFWFNQLSGISEKFEATVDMNIGSAVHTLTLEPQLFDEEFFITRQQSKPRKGTAPYEKMIEESNLRIILTPAEAFLAQTIARQVNQDENASLLIKDSLIEHSIFFNHRETGIQCKARPDVWSNKLIMDLKTSKDANPRFFMNECVTRGYYLQAGMMHEALASIDVKLEQFGFIVVEKTAPFVVAVYPMKQEALEYGVNLFNKTMSGLARCLEANQWPGYQFTEIGLPGYLKFEQEIELEI